MKLNLDKAIPFIKSEKKRFTISFLFSLYIYVFLYIFTPFGVSDISDNKAIYLFGFFLITFLVLFIFFFLMPKVFKEWFEKWTIKKMILFSLTNILLISCLNWSYSQNFPVQFSKNYSVVDFFYFTVSVGVFPIVLLVVYIKNLKRKKEEKLIKVGAKNVLEQLEEKITITSLNNQGTFSCLLSQFLLVKSEGNYVKIYFIHKEVLSQKMIYNSLINVEKQLQNYNFIMRCHRSFIANFNHVNRITGNQRNYKLHIEELPFSVPVSRSFPRENLEKLIV